MRKGRRQWSRFEARRPLGRRLLRPTVVVVCDDTRTAVAYFRVLAREVKDKVTVMVVPAPCQGASAEEVAAMAEREAADLFLPRDGHVEGDSVWALIDREAEVEKQRKADQAKKDATGKDYQVLLSQPCYEVWTLAHLVDTGEQFRDCKAVWERIKVEWKKRFEEDLDNKGRVDHEKLMPLRSDAVSRARKRVKKDPSWTEVYRVVEAIDAVK